MRQEGRSRGRSRERKQSGKVHQGRSQGSPRPVSTTSGHPRHLVVMPFPLSKVGGILSLKISLQLVAQSEPQGCSHRGSQAHSRSISAGFQLQIASSLQHLSRVLSITSVTVLLTQPSAAEWSCVLVCLGRVIIVGRPQVLSFPRWGLLSSGPYWLLWKSSLAGEWLVFSKGHSGQCRQL